MERQFSKLTNTNIRQNTEPFFSDKKEEPFFKPANNKINPNIYGAKERDRGWLGRQQDQGKFYTGNSDNARIAHEENNNWLNGKELIYIVDAGNIDPAIGIGAYWFVDTTKGDGLQTITPKRVFLEEPFLHEEKIMKFKPSKESKKPEKAIKKVDISKKKEVFNPIINNKPKPKISELTLDVPFIARRTKFLGDPSKNLNAILEKLLDNPRNFVRLSPNTEFSKGEDFFDFWGLTGDVDTSDELVIGRGETIRKWFLDRGVASSQIIIDTSNSFNKPLFLLIFICGFQQTLPVITGSVCPSGFINLRNHHPATGRADPGPAHQC